MEATLTIISGGCALRDSLEGAAGVNGAFYNWPVQGEQLTMFVDTDNGFTTLTTAKVTRVYAQTNLACEFECQDGRFRLNVLSNRNGMMVNNRL